MTGQKTFLVMAGGTGGHVFPALATARHLQSLGHRVHWLGARGGMEVQWVGQTDIPLSLIPITGLRGKGKATLLLAPVKLIRAVALALGIIRRVRPDCVIGMGGFASGPGGIAAWLARKPLVIHEQNAVAGMTNRWLSRVAQTTLEAFPGAFGPDVVTRCTGNPVRQDLAEVAPPEERLGSREGALRVLILGGSRGAQAINQTVPQALAHCGRPVEVRHQAGAGNEGETEHAYQKAGVSAKVTPFIEDMAEAYSWADLVICRAGALTLAELCAVGLGSVLVPFPHAVDDHQTRNARYLADAGAAILMPQGEMTPEALGQLLKGLASDRAQLQKMASSARAQARPDATERVVNYCLEAAHA